MKTRSKVPWLVGTWLSLIPFVGHSNFDPLLPDVTEVVKRAIERGKHEAENDLKFKQQYYFERSRKTEIRNAAGDIKKSKLRISTNAPAVVATSPAPVVAAQVPRTAAKSEVPAELAGKLDKKEFQFNQDLANRFDFKLVRREQTNGTSLLVVDFTPKKTKLPEHGIRDRVINRMAGRIWVDEREYAVKKAALNLTQSISIVGGIVGEAKKFQYAFDRERTDDGLWYVRESKWHLEGRQVVVHREADYHELRTNVRKLAAPAQ